jgi:hypothetical protein
MTCIRCGHSIGAGDSNGRQSRIDNVGGSDSCGIS